MTVFFLGGGGEGSQEAIKHVRSNHRSRGQLPQGCGQLAMMSAVAMQQTSCQEAAFIK